MPLPREARELETNLDSVQSQMEGVATSIAALPATPLEADLPDIVQVVADLADTAAALKVVVDTIANVLATTRINQ